MTAARRILAMCPPKKITQQDDAGFVEALLASDETRTISFSEDEFNKLASAIGNRSSEFGVWWVTHEEDWVEGHENLKGFADLLSKSKKTESDARTLELLTSLHELAEFALGNDVPLIIQS